MRTETLPVDPGNEQQLAAWDGDEGAYWAERADHYDRAIAGHDGPFRAAAAIRPTDRVIDVGCGNGQNTREAARLARDGSVLGVDLSAAMLDHARRTAAAEGLGNVSFLQADAQIHPFEPDSFDVAICRTSAMFFADPTAALANIGGALAPAGRLVMLTWQPLEGNEWLGAIATALAGGRQPQIPPPGVGPFSLSDPDRIRTVLGEAGFGDVDVVGNRAPMWFGTDAKDAQQFILGQMAWMLEGLDDAGRDDAVDALLAVTTAHEGADGVTFDSATWLTTARVG